MAIGLSHLFSSMAGSVAGITYFRNRYASIVMRERVTPVDPRTVPQQTVRARMSAGVASWQALSDANRQSWEIYASGTPWKNSLAQDVRLTGFNMYLSVLLAAQMINPTLNVALLATAFCTPGLNIQPKVTFSPCVGGSAGFNINFVNPHPTDNMRVGVHISTAQNTTVNFWKGPYDSTNYQSTNSIPPGFGTTINYKLLTVDKRYFLRIRCWNNTQKTLVSSPMLLHRDASACTP